MNERERKEANKLVMIISEHFTHTSREYVQRCCRSTPEDFAYPGGFGITLRNGSKRISFTDVKAKKKFDSHVIEAWQILQKK